MNKNNLIRFAQSLLFLPFVTGTTVPMGSILMNTTEETIRTVFIQKENIEADGFLAFNQVIDQKAKDSKAKAEAIDSYFESKDMPLLGMGMKMVEEAEKNNLDWRLLPAIAVRESTGGKFECKKVSNNPFGWGSCKIGFDSNEEAIETVARNLGGNNPNTEKHYDNKTTKQILRAYNPPSIVLRYAEQVISIMNAIGPEDMTLAVNS
ncbi:hypothetical protein A3B84_01270 [Candidatus Nomurabacteria bacterium RIFCSPHIGHO2_02_FULL_35_13]|uniref:Mannosyl-glycoprotein endo-beta-N-acetylglucosamidase-like domain-containing protein n=1 Tax=Candidatus Nomurabacteria bacterium RIFCSPHIGHO2_02_FULL_35_13 TaxID=1801748 RepID=A0A1F6VMG6_9BACT|nr:MAG: hypothetical protein A3B84_01270 [Candidatus Nomurabacteria bacterium RIFCSPHIGHO2_02_FULL_35_13]